MMKRCYTLATRTITFFFFYKNIQDTNFFYYITAIFIISIKNFQLMCTISKKMLLYKYEFIYEMIVYNVSIFATSCTEIVQTCVYMFMNK